MDSKLDVVLEKYYGVGSIDESKVSDINEMYPIRLSDFLLNRLETEFLPELAMQFLPNILELSDAEGIGAFFDDEKEISTRVFQKYPNRCIIYTTSFCYANCRFCSRKERWRDANKFIYSKDDFDEALKSIRDLPEIEEVLLTGGDVLTIPVDQIEYMIKGLSDIPHVKMIRLGTRAFTTNPHIITPKFCEMLSKYNNIVVCTQFNHPTEFSEDTVTSLRNVQRTGTPILNQSVLLKGVNDSTSVLRELLSKCATNRVIPYYLFHCFKVKGVEHFRTEPLLGQELISSLIGKIGGWWIPRYILIPHSTGAKIPLCHNGVVRNDEDGLLLEDFKGRKVEYI
ncbi:MAG: radical SAM protein [Oscillospiraceae bacterium]|nr:radical SAM protein [Oscillospiraceae bacterium]